MTHDANLENLKVSRGGNIRAFDLRYRGGWTDLLFTLALLEAVAGTPPTFVGNPSVTRQLLLTYILLGLTIAALPIRHLPGWVKFAVTCLAAMPVIGVIAWTIEVGWAMSISEWAGWQPWVLLTGCIPFALAYGRQRAFAWQRIVIAVGCALATYQTVVLLLRVVGVSHSQSSVYGDFYGMRPVTAASATLILVAFIFAVTGRKQMRFQCLIAVYLGISVIVSQHRAAWVAFAVAAVLLLLRAWKGTETTAVLPLVITGVVAALSILSPTVLGVSLLPTANSTKQAPGLPDVVTSTKSLDWRLQMWETRLTAPREPTNYLVGGVLGVTPVKTPGTDVFNPQLNAHSMPVDMYVMFGAVGLGLLSSLVVAATLGRRDPFSPDAISMSAIGAFGLFNNWPHWSWLLLGTALALRRPLMTSDGNGR
jgi:hypothetical protein